MNLPTDIYPDGLTSGNFCNNGHTDLDYAQFFTNYTVGLFCNTGSTGSAAFTGLTAAEGNYSPAYGAASGNLCNNGRTDLGVYFGGAVGIYCNTGSTGSAAFGTSTENLPAAGGDVYTANNLCNNSLTDVLSIGGGAVYIDCNTGSTGASAFSGSTSINLPVAGASGIATGDMCGNGRTDLAVTDSTDGVVNTYCNTGSGGSAAFLSTPSVVTRTGNTP